MIYWVCNHKFQRILWWEVFMFCDLDILISLIQTAKLINLSLWWSRLNKANGCKFLLISLSASSGSSCVSVKAKISLLKIFSLFFMSIQCFLRDLIFTCNRLWHQYLRMPTHIIVIVDFFCGHRQRGTSCNEVSPMLSSKPEKQQRNQTTTQGTTFPTLCEGCVGS